MNITIAGYGFVGQAHEQLLDYYDVTIYDPHKGYSDFGKPEGVIVCVSTPPRPDGSCNIENVYDVIERSPDVPILIKSTISLEGWEMLVETFPNKKLSFSPEFLRANTAVEDLQNAKETYIGGGDIEFWKWVLQKPVREFDPRSLVLAKYFRNSFLATKVSFFNQMYDLCKAVDVDYESVRQAVTEDSRIGDSHSWVTEQRGFGGHCFPKDTTATIKTAQRENVNLSLIKEAIEYNSRIRKD